jgi:hypothetical protein
MRVLIAVLVAFFTTVLARADNPGPDPTLARRYFAEARALWQQDGGRLWGVSLEGPLLFADRVTRRVVANAPDRFKQLREENGVYVGQLDPDVPIANTATTWAEVKWTMVVWPLPRDRDARAVLLMHESWHRVQDRLGLPGAAPANHHLDTADGRLWLQLEWRALRQALLRDGDARRDAIADALLFRAFRRSLFAKAAAEERALEMHEGLAEYTGVKLSGMADADQRLYAARALESRPPAMPSFVRSFAYLSGPAYGLLLDAGGASWRPGLKPTHDLGALLAQTLKLPAPTLTKAEAEARAQRYGGDQLRAAEQERERARQKRLAEYRALFVDGPVLTLPLQDPQFSFDPNQLHPLEGQGTVYGFIKLTDTWGVLTAPNGALMAADFKRATVSAPADSKTLKGDGWELELKKGWRLVPGNRKGDLMLIKDK